MKLEIGKPDYDCKDPFKKASIRGWRPGKEVPLVVLTIEKMRERHDTLKALRAVPTFAAYDPDAKKVWLFPCPNGEFELDLEFDAPVVPAAPSAPKRLARALASAVGVAKGDDLPR